MREYVREAHSRGATLIAFPEMAYLMAPPEGWLPALSKYRFLLGEFSSWAKKYSVILVPGSVREPDPKSKDRFYNTLPVFDSTGDLVVVYRKIFLFTAKLPDRNYDETRFCNPGNRPMVRKVGGLNFGLSICFDLRFPELYRVLKRRKAQLVLVPSAFTVPTGKVHWHVLLKARAIENQFFVLAPGQVGKAGDGSEKYGHSLVESPWGEVLVDMETEEGVRVQDLDFGLMAEAQSKIDIWASRREDIFPLGPLRKE